MKPPLTLIVGNRELRFEMTGRRYLLESLLIVQEDAVRLVRRKDIHSRVKHYILLVITLTWQR